MDLAVYFETQPRGAMRRMAEELGVSPAMVSQWAGGDRPIPPRFVPRIERMTGMSVRRWAMCPDWADIWEDLVGLPGSPAAEVRIPNSSATTTQPEGAAA